MARITLRSQYRGWQPETTIEVDQDAADMLVKNGQASKAEAVYSHEDEMSPEVKAESHKALAAAEAAGGVNAVAARSAATELFRKKK